MSSQCPPLASGALLRCRLPSSLLSPGDTAPLWLAHSGTAIPPSSQAVSGHRPRGVHSPATVSGWPPDSASSGQQSPAPGCSGSASPTASDRQATGARAGVASSTAGQVSSHGSWASPAAYPASISATVAPSGTPPGPVSYLVATSARSGTAAG